MRTVKDDLPGHDRRVRLTRCPNCGRENYAGNVATGQCAWCYWDANDPRSGIAWNNHSSETAERKS